MLGRVGKVTAKLENGSTAERATSKRTKFLRLAHEKPIAIDLTNIGDTPALKDFFLSTSSVLESLDLSALEGHRGIESLTAAVKAPFDLTPLASTTIESLSIDLAGSKTLDFKPLYKHKTLASVSLGFLGTQKKLDLSFVRELPKLTSLSIDGGDWKTLDLSPLKGIKLESFTLIRQYVSEVDLKLIAQPALEQLMLQELEIKEGYWALSPLAVCKDLQFLSLLGAEVGTLDVTALAKLPKLRRFDAPNFKQMMSAVPVSSPGLLAWKDSIGVE
jgi:hypothetical protein